LFRRGDEHSAIGAFARSSRRRLITAMTPLLLEAELVARKEIEIDERPVGPRLVKNLFKLGYADIVVRSAEIARIVSERTGRKLTRQRVSALMNAVRVEPETIELLAKGLGVKPADLLKDDETDRSKK
jgi:hypothetical protein